MFVGLIRMRRDGAGASALGRLLWKQVRQWRALLGYLLANAISVREGITWLLFATVVELPPLVRPAGFLIRLLTHHDFAS